MGINHGIVHTAAVSRMWSNSSLMSLNRKPGISLQLFFFWLAIFGTSQDIKSKIEPWLGSWLSLARSVNCISVSMPNSDHRASSAAS